MEIKLVIYLFWSSIAVTSLMLMANPFFEDKELLKATAIPAFCGWLLGLIWWLQ